MPKYIASVKGKSIKVTAASSAKARAQVAAEYGLDASKVKVRRACPTMRPYPTVTGYKGGGLVAEIVEVKANGRRALRNPQTSWEAKAHELIAKHSLAAAKAARSKSGKWRPYSTPEIADALVTALGIHDDKVREETIKHLFHIERVGAYTQIPPHLFAPQRRTRAHQAQTAAFNAHTKGAKQKRNCGCMANGRKRARGSSGGGTAPFQPWDTVAFVGSGGQNYTVTRVREAAKSDYGVSIGEWHPGEWAVWVKAVGGKQESGPYKASSFVRFNVNGAASYVRANGHWSDTPFGWAKVLGGRVVKLSAAQRKPSGGGWGAVNTSSTSMGDRAYLDGGVVYLR